MPDLNLVVFTYQSENEALEALTFISNAKEENTQVSLVAIDDAVVAHKTTKGKVKIQQTLESIVKGTEVARGGLWGLLVGFLFGGPLIGALIGVGIKALGSRNIDLEIDNGFITAVSESLEPGQSALFLLTSSAEAVAIGDALGDRAGTLHHTTLSEEDSASLTELASDDIIGPALAAHHE